jgi:kynurenine formamidase
VTNASPTPRWKRRPPGSTWGDFGSDDQIGRMNLITTTVRRAALAEASEGLAFVLSLPLDYPGGSVLTPNRKPPQRSAARLARGGDNYLAPFTRFGELFCDVCNDDAVLLHTQYSTQWDALSHMGYPFDADDDGRAEIVFYNGYRAGEHILGPAQDGGPRAASLGIENLAWTGAQGRGVLVDLHARYGRAPARVGYDDLMRCIAEQKVEVRVGDFLCLYTGFGDVLLEQKGKPDPQAVNDVCAALDGRDEKLLQWITESGVAAICADNVAVEVTSAKPHASRPHPMMPLHEHCLFKLGVHLGELWHLSELATWLAAKRRSAFLLTAPPLRLPGCVGSPVTPVATV